MQLREDIPEPLRAPAHAALTWINAHQGREFTLSGVLADDAVCAVPPSEGYELGLVLCDGELCAVEQVRVQGPPENYRFSVVERDASEIPALLDPPQGVRRDWLIEKLEQHEFLLLLYYRGRW